MLTKEAICSYALSKVLYLTPKAARDALEMFSSAEELFKLSPSGISDVLGPYNKIAAELKAVKLEKAEEELHSLEQQGYRYLSHDNPAFPEILEMCEDAPLGIFVWSHDSFENIFSRENIAIVGTRDSSPYGTGWTGHIVKALASTQTKPTIVSGLAYGIDIAAHRAALSEGLPTIAVLGTGIGKIYPSHHAVWAEKIIETPCSAVISEYPPDITMTNVNFLCRNRIIAGLSKATLLMESRVKGGGMSTARIAESYGRMVFALPGRNDDSRSQGCNYLLHSHIAEPIIDCDNLLRSLEYKSAAPSKAALSPKLQNRYDSKQVEQMSLIIAQIKKHRGISPDELCTALNMSYKELMTALTILESDGFIKMDILNRCTII